MKTYVVRRLLALIPVSLAAPSVVTLYECPLDLSGVLVVGISQSGESTDTNAVLADARRRGATTIGITTSTVSMKTVDPFKAASHNERTALDGGIAALSRIGRGSARHQ